MYCSYFSVSAHYFSGNFVSAFHDISYYIEKYMPAEHTYVEGSLGGKKITWAKIFKLCYYDINFTQNS